MKGPTTAEIAEYAELISAISAVSAVNSLIFTTGDRGAKIC